MSDHAKTSKLIDIIDSSEFSEQFGDTRWVVNFPGETPYQFGVRDLLALVARLEKAEKRVDLLETEIGGFAYRIQSLAEEMELAA